MTIITVEALAETRFKKDDFDFPAAIVPMAHRRFGIARDYRIPSRTANASGLPPQVFDERRVYFS
jgi:hypothetical protein